MLSIKCSKHTLQTLHSPHNTSDTCRTDVKRFLWLKGKKKKKILRCLQEPKYSRARDYSVYLGVSLNRQRINSLLNTTIMPQGEVTDLIFPTESHTKSMRWEKGEENLKRRSPQIYSVNFNTQVSVPILLEQCKIEQVKFYQKSSGIKIHSVWYPL